MAKWSSRARLTSSTLTSGTPISPTKGDRTIFLEDLANFLANLAFVAAGRFGPGCGDRQVVELPYRVFQRDVRIKP